MAGDPGLVRPSDGAARIDRPFGVTYGLCRSAAILALATGVVRGIRLEVKLPPTGDLGRWGALRISG